MRSVRRRSVVFASILLCVWEASVTRTTLFEAAPGTSLLALGNQAIARGAIEAGVQFATGYPGTPSTEIMETLIEAAPRFGFVAYWSVNEKVAFDAATGASFSNARCMAVMKHVGLNVAADSLQQLKLIDIAGGFVVVSVDDPSGVSSNNEQDNRWYAKFAGLPALEPTDLDEAREMTKRAFEISEELRMPVIVRSVTRLGHMTGDLGLGKIEPARREPHFDSSREWTPFPCLEPEQRLRAKLRKAGQVLERYHFDEYFGHGSEKIGVVGAGFAFNYVQEAVDVLDLKDEVALLKVSTVNPLPSKIIQRLLSHASQVLVVEDVTPFLEQAIRAEAQGVDRRIEIHGRGSGALPEVGETILDDVVSALAKLIRRESPEREFSPGALPSEERAELSAATQDLIPRRQIGFCACLLYTSDAADE